MIKQKKYSIADSNIALLGSELETKVRLESAKHEDAWQVAGKEEGLQIWRVEKFKIVPWPVDQYGKFFEGDSYICLKTYKVGREGKDVFMWDIHYWLGGYSSTDEMGTAAYKTVELDIFLGGSPVQYREIQDHESKRFLSLFPHGVHYLAGGVETGFRHVGPEKYEPRLLHIKGKKFIRVTQVELARNSLNSGDAFILDAGLKIYLFLGASSGSTEAARAQHVAVNIDDSRKGLPEIITIREKDSSHPQFAEFWAFLGGEGPIHTAAEGGSDEEADQEELKEHQLYRLSDASGKLTFDKVAEGLIKRNMLDSSDVFIVDIGEQIFVWVGKASSPQEKRFAVKYGQDYMNHAKRPLTLPITKLTEGYENEDFFSYVKLR